MPDAENWLNPQSSDRKLGQKSVVGITLQFLNGVFVLAFAAILARLLPPEDFGIIASIAPAIALVGMLKDFGISTAIIQSQELSQDIVSTFFWLQALLGLALGAGLALAAPLVVHFYDDPRMHWLCVAMGAIVFIGVLGGVHDALMRKSLLFGRVTAIQFLGSFMGLIAAVVFALGGTGYWALVIQQAVMAVVVAAGSWLACSWRPSKYGFEKAATSGLMFGGSLTVGKFVDFIRKNTDIILIRKVAGPEQLGLYGRSTTIVLLPVLRILGPVMSVALPMLSRKQNDDDYLDYFEHIFTFAVACAIPAGVFTFCFPDAVVWVVLGEDWLDAIEILRGIGIIAMALPIGNCVSVNLLVFKKTKVLVFLPILACATAVVAFFIGIQESVAKLAEYYGYASAATTLIYCYVVSRVTRLKIRRLIRITVRPALAMALAVAIAHFSTANFAGSTMGFNLGLITMGSFSVSYAFILLFVMGYARKLQSLIAFLKNR